MGNQTTRNLNTHPLPKAGCLYKARQSGIFSEGVYAYAFSCKPRQTISKVCCFGQFDQQQKHTGLSLGNLNYLDLVAMKHTFLTMYAISIISVVDIV